MATHEIIEADTKHGKLFFLVCNNKNVITRTHKMERTGKPPKQCSVCHAILKHHK